VFQALKDAGTNVRTPACIEGRKGRKSNSGFLYCKKTCFPPILHLARIIIANKCLATGAANVMDRAKVSPQYKSKDRSPSTAADTETLNFKVTTEFKKEFKGYAVSQGISMVELLKEGFELTKRKRKE
jgi:hypothetical protein